LADSRQIQINDMKVPLIFLMLLLASTANSQVTEDKLAEFKERVENRDLFDENSSDQRPYARWIMALSEAERAALIPIVQAHRDTRDLDSRDEWNGLLAYLGDEEAARLNIENWRSTWGHRLEVQYAETGQVPVFLEPELLRDEKFIRPNFPGTPSFDAAVFLLYYLPYNKHYPQDVRDWAARAQRNMNLREDWTPVRKVVRDWYQANEAFIRAKQYDKVKAGEELPPRPSLLKESGLPESPPPPVINTMQGRDVAPPQPPASSAPEPERKASGNYVLFAAISAVLAAIILFTGIRLARKKPRAP